MLLVSNIGNTRIKLAFYEDGEIVWRQAVPVEGFGEFAVEWGSMGLDLDFSLVWKAVYCSVNPTLELAFREWVVSTWDIPAEKVGYRGELPLDLEIEVDEPWLVGGDRLVNVFAVRELLGAPALVVDFGTAITIDVLSAKGSFLGGAIIPGARTMARSLAEKAALLPEILLTPARSAIGRTTEDAINAGVYYGVGGMVEGLLAKMQQELDGAPKVVGTGGDVAMFAPVCPTIEQLHPQLTLEGLRLAAERAS